MTTPHTDRATMLHRAAEYMRSVGFQVLDSDWHQVGETLDIVAADRRVMVVCEVKSRNGARYRSPLDAVGRAKLKRLRILAASWISAHGVRFDEIRIDVVSLVYEASGGFTIEHVRGVA